METRICGGNGGGTSGGTALGPRNSSISSDKPYKLINFFSINNELDMLEIHFQEYWDLVDTFVVMESSLTFSNQQKPLHLAPALCTPRFAPYLPKLVHVVLDASLRGPNDDAWAWEAAHRDAMQAVGNLLGLQPTDLLLSGDVDELPYASAVAEGANIVWNSLAADNSTLPVVEWGLTMYYFSLFHQVPEPWEHYAKVYPFAVREVASFSAMRTVKSVPRAGVHATYFFRWESLMLKLRSFSHFDHWEWGAGQTDAELIERARTNLQENRGWLGAELTSVEPAVNPELLPYKPAVHAALIAQSLALHEAQLGPDA
ncbi:hypothetical protein D9Q98_001290 [Chlorella vulgaris]|uniref:Uncharacterized protein n=1 Tax=Chlorella vulgaris TaxID=3077 RepID=A0A9D4TZV4_CHLVU|nr:hypothetical protein D9Q98_001290 [Chlorella vulgaris]